MLVLYYDDFFGMSGTFRKACYAALLWTAYVSVFLVIESLLFILYRSFPDSQDTQHISDIMSMLKEISNTAILSMTFLLFAGIIIQLIVIQIKRLLDKRRRGENHD
jgi:ABC-type Fe3+ transport system permease subunit